MNETGNFDYTVDVKGNLIGSFTNIANNQVRSVSGKVNNSGKFGGTTTLNGVTGSISGTLSTSGGDFTLAESGRSSSGNFLLGATAGGGGDSTFHGSYNGSFNIPGLTQSGTVSFSVDQNGVIIGLFSKQGGETGTFTGSINSSGNFTGTIAYPSGTVPITGTLQSGTGTVPTGNFQETVGGKSYAGTFGASSVAPDSPFRGAYSGSFSISGVPSNPSGQVSYSVDSTGAITGSFASPTETGVFTGTVQTTGAFIGTVAYPSGTVSVSGTLQTSSTGASVGNFIETVGGKSYPGVFGPTTVITGDSPYKGSYRGTYSIPEQTENGNVSLTVDPSGTATGFFSQSNNSPVATFTGALNNNGTFSGNLSYDPSTGIATRPISGKLGTSTVSNQLAGDFVVTINGVGEPGNMELSVGASEPDSNFVGTYAGPTISDGFFLSQITGDPGLDNPGANGAINSTANEADALVIDQKTGAITGHYAFVSTLSISVDKEGSVIGTLAGEPFEGRVTNDGRFVGTITSTSTKNTYVMRGIIAKENIKELTTYAINPKTDSSGNVIGYTPTYNYDFEAGISGNIVITVNGNDYSGYLAGIGGQTKAASILTRAVPLHNPRRPHG